MCFTCCGQNQHTHTSLLKALTLNGECKSCAVCSFSASFFRQNQANNPLYVLEHCVVVKELNMQTCVVKGGKRLLWLEASSLHFTFGARLKIKALLPAAL